MQLWRSKKQTKKIRVKICELHAQSAYHEIASYCATYHLRSLKQTVCTHKHAYSVCKYTCNQSVHLSVLQLNWASRYQLAHLYFHCTFNLLYCFSMYSDFFLLIYSFTSYYLYAKFYSCKSHWMTSVYDNMFNEQTLTSAHQVFNTLKIRRFIQ